MSKLAHSNQATMDEIEARRCSREDAEANAFAMAILMPENFLRRDLAKLKGFDIDDGIAIKKLADKYRVSQTLMTLRIGQLMSLSGDKSMIGGKE